MSQFEALGLTFGGVAITVLMIWGGRRRSLSRLARTSMVAGSFGFLFCAKFAPRAETFGDQLMLLAFAAIMGILAFEGWRDPSNAAKLAT